MTKTNKPSTKSKGAPATPVTKLSLLLAQLGRGEGATIEQLTAATGWQQHSVRGVIAGTLKRKGHRIASFKADGIRRYRLENAS